MTRKDRNKESCTLEGWASRHTRVGAGPKRRIEIELAQVALCASAVCRRFRGQKHVQQAKLMGQCLQAAWHLVYIERAPSSHKPSSRKSRSSMSIRHAAISSVTESAGRQIGLQSDADA